MRETIAREMMHDLFLPFPVHPALDSVLEAATPEQPIDRVALSRAAVQPGVVSEIRHEFDFPGVASIATQTGTWYELARIPSHYGKITTLRSIHIWQNTSRIMGFSDFIGTRLYEAIGAQYWLQYIPLPAQQQRLVIPFIYAATKPPGYPCFEMPPWNDQRFHSQNTIDLQIPITPGYCLSLFCRIEGIAFLPPNWQAAAQYNRGDIVFQNGRWWVCIIENTGSQAPGPDTRPQNSPNLWTLIADGTGVYCGWKGRLTATVQSERETAAFLNSRRSAY